MVLGGVGGSYERGTSVRVPAWRLALELSPPWPVLDVACPPKTALPTQMWIRSIADSKVDTFDLTWFVFSFGRM